LLGRDAHSNKDERDIVGRALVCIRSFVSERGKEDVWRSEGNELRVRSRHFKDLSVYSDTLKISLPFSSLPFPSLLFFLFLF